MHQLLPATAASAGQTPWQSEAWAISRSPEIAVGLEDRTVCIPDPADPTKKICDYEQYPVIWKNVSTKPAAVRLGTMPGRAFGINDAGTLAVGVSGDGVGAIWSSDSNWTAASRIYVPSSVNLADARTPFPDGHFQKDPAKITYEGTAWDVNDGGIVVGTLTTIDQEALAQCSATDVRPCVPDVSYSRSYIYMSGSGTFKVLPTPAGHKETSAYAVSDTTGGNVYVAGWTGWRTEDRSTEINRAIRWTVDASAGTSNNEEVLIEQAWAEGVTQDGLVAGTHNSEPNRRGNIIQTATLWSATAGYIPLKPSGGSDSTSRAMAGRCPGSGGPIYVVGEANVSGAWIAARWTIQCSTVSPSP
jgi:hypothetical protein